MRFFFSFWEFFHFNWKLFYFLSCHPFHVLLTLSFLDDFPLIRLYHNSINIIGSEQFNMLLTYFLLSYFVKEILKNKLKRKAIKEGWMDGWKGGKNNKRGYLACKFLILMSRSCLSWFLSLLSFSDDKNKAELPSHHITHAILLFIGTYSMIY